MERHQRVAARQVLAQVDLSDPQDSRERGTDGLPVDRGTDFSYPCLRLPLVGGGAIELRARDDALVQQALHPLEVQTREIALRFRRGQLRLLLARIEQRQHFALTDRRAGFETDPVHRAGQVRAHGDALNRGDCSDRAQRGRPLLLLRHDGRDRFRRRLKRRRLSDGGLNLLELDEAQSRDEHDRHGQHQNHSFRHEVPHLRRLQQFSRLTSKVARNSTTPARCYLNVSDITKVTAARGPLEDGHHRLA